MEIKDQALASSDALRKLAMEHTQYDQRLNTLLQKRYLNEDEKIEEVRLKKLKLKVKDEIMKLEHSFGTSHPA
jgi:hypothetical protein